MNKEQRKRLREDKTLPHGEVHWFNEPPKKKQKRCCEACMAPNCLGPVPVDKGEDMLAVSMPGLTIINAKSQSGKSHLIRYMCYKNRGRIHWVEVYSNTCREGNNFDYVEDDHKHSTFSAAHLKQVLAEHAKARELKKKPNK